MRLLLPLILSLAAMPFAMAQQDETASAYLFPDFEDAVIYFSNGASSSEKVNYNLLDRCLYFIDRRDGELRIATQMDEIRVIRVGKRNFVPVRDGIHEVLPTTPPIYVEYQTRTKRKPQQVGYGTSEVASVASYKRMIDATVGIQDMQLQVTDLQNCYWIERNGKKKKFADFRQFLKLYPKHREALEKHIKDNAIDFNNADQVANLCLYAEGLASE
ncbi:MAG: hypothetical protein LBR84_07130 [Tannerella sp.]|jgi:hypothetical protein|nr:hypothetical protein [Tannerella sp.]